GIDETSTSEMQGPIVNNPPQLVNPQVSPSLGKVGDAFTFSVVYKDIDGDPPQNMTIIIKDENGNSLPAPNLTQEGNNPATGIKFSGSEVISQQGTYTVQFTVTDGKPNGQVKSDIVTFGVGVILVQPSPNKVDVAENPNAQVSIKITYLVNQGIKLTITDPDGQSISKEVFTDATGNASFTLTPDKLGTWAIDATDKATQQSKGSATFSVQATHQFPPIELASFPFALANNPFGDIIGSQVFDQNKLLIAIYDPQIGNYATVNKDSTLSTATGFWMKTTDGNPIKLALSKGSRLEGIPVTVPLKKVKTGWNIIGIPYFTNLDLSEVFVQYTNPQTNQPQRVSLS
ncbi:MAG: hypothetical protein ACP5KZ_09915, partial [bacterium]